MRIVVTGGDGFIGRNLRVRLGELRYSDLVNVGRHTTDEDLRRALETADFVFHLAGVNRPADVAAFDTGNRGFTATVCDALRSAGKALPVAYASSTQVLRDNPYGASKLAAEEELTRYGHESGTPVYVFRLPNVFGKWCRPNYNSAVATFCHNIARRLPIHVHDATTPLHLLYVDDLVTAMIRLLDQPTVPGGQVSTEPVFTTTVGDVVAMITDFANSRDTLRPGRVGEGLARALYATYLSCLPVDDFAYDLLRHVDARGVFAEVFKTPDCGQFSFFTAHPGVTRGGHYHHTKSEKFLVLTGHARFGFRQILTGEHHAIEVRGTDSRVIETVPGWAHDITNIGGEDLVVMLWASEVFDPERPDTVSSPLTA